MDLYDILEIKPNASKYDIRKSYLRLVKIYHPDKCFDKDANIKFRKIQSAYEILVDDKNREKYIKMNVKDKTNFQILLEKVFNNNLKIDELKIFGINFSKIDWEYLQENFNNIISNINIKDLVNLYVNGIINKNNINNINCSDSDIECWKETQATYLFNLPIKYNSKNNLDIIINLNITISDIINLNKKKIKIKRQFEDENITTTYIFNIEKPYIIFTNGGDMDNGDYGDLIIKLNLPENFFWDDNIIIYQYPITLYNMIYGLDINIKLDQDLIITYNNWVASRDGLLINVDKVNIKNYLFAIKLVLDYEHTNEKENILLKYFSK
jgi:DnaJ-class molecular chaperone